MGDKPRVLIVETSSEATKLRRCFEAEEYVLGTAHTPDEALGLLSTQKWELALVNSSLSDSTELDLEAQLRNIDSEMTILTVVDCQPGRGVDALKLHAYDFVTRPIDELEVGNRAANAIKHKRTELENLRLSKLLADETGKSLDEVERAHILRVLESCQGNRSRAAEILRIDRSTLYEKLRLYSDADNS